MSSVNIPAPLASFSIIALWFSGNILLRAPPIKSTPLFNVPTPGIKFIKPPILDCGPYKNSESDNIPEGIPIPLDAIACLYA